MGTLSGSQAHNKGVPMRTLLNCLIAVAVLLVITTSIAVALMSYKQASALYQQEAECIAKHIAAGIERSDIIVTPGQCSVRR